MFSLRLIAICAAILLSAFVSSSGAATIEIENGQDCEVSLTGQITTGDYERLQILVTQISENAPLHSGGPMRLCLHSSGGSLEEGARIARLVREWGLATRIQAGDSCLSACAWIFMLGTTDQFWGEIRGEYDFIDREMDANATLGFHAPLLELGQQQVIRTELAQQGYRALVAAFAEILSLSYNPEGRDLIDADLLEHAMRTPPARDSFYYIDTIDKAGRWNIRVSGISFPTPLSEAAAENACLNGTAWRIALSEVRYSFGFEAQNTEYLEGDDAYEILGPLNGYAGHGCTISRNLEPALEGVETEFAPRALVRGCFNDDYQGLNYCGAIDAISVFPPSTLLNDLSGEYGRSLARQLSGSPSVTQALPSCIVGPNQSRVRVINVNEFVNIRTGPSLQTSIVARANLGEMLNITDARFWYYETTRGRQCAILCERYNASTASRNLSGQVQECIEDAQIWQQVRNSRGQTGYVSVYFLEAAGQ